MNIYREKEIRRRRVKIIIWSVVALVAGVCAYYYFCCLNRPGDKERLSERSVGDIRVGTVNIDGFRFLSSPDLTAEFLLKCARDNELDLLVVQEYMSFRGMDRLDFQNMFKDDYPYIHIEGEHALISKMPLLTHRSVTFADKDDRFMLYRLEDYDCDTLNFVAVHLHTTGLFTLERTPMQKDGESIKVVINTLRATAALRRAQARMVRECVDTLRGPVIVAGDFNSVPGSKVGHIVKGRDLVDSFRESGHGKGSTYRQMKDILRIDYILHGDGLRSTATVIPDDYISDHRAVVTNLRKTR